MKLADKIEEILTLSNIAPVIVVGVPLELLGESTVLAGDIDTKELGIVNTAKGLVAPKWFDDISRGKSSKQIVIDGIDKVYEPYQEKFYEIIKYKEISNVPLPSGCTIILTVDRLDRVSKNIASLCMVIK
ncbi:MAG: hypothetical protein E7356_00920 [Clostridiales bacterium]|nr:hypothetical protein [Clostridiales bacterium]